MFVCAIHVPGKSLLVQFFEQNNLEQPSIIFLGRKGCKEGGNITKCKKCGGHGVVMKLVQMGPGMCIQTRGKCDDCEGAGDIVSEEDKCTACKGEKREEGKKEFTIKLDPGCPENKEYEFPGEGNEIVCMYYKNFLA